MWQDKTNQQLTDSLDLVISNQERKIETQVNRTIEGKSCKISGKLSKTR